MRSQSKYKLVVFDQDGVLVLGDALDDMAEFLGAKPESKKITEMWHRHEIDLAEAIRRKEALLTKFPEEEIQSAKENIKYDPEAAETIRKLKKRGLKIMVITGSPYITVNHTQDKLGADFTAATDDKLVLEKDNKEIPLRAKMKEIKIKPEEIVVVGDSFSDEKILELAGLGLVIRPRQGLEKKFKEIKSLTEILDYV